MIVGLSNMIVHLALTLLMVIISSLWVRRLPSIWHSCRFTGC